MQVVDVNPHITVISVTYAPVWDLRRDYVRSLLGWTRTSQHDPEDRSAKPCPAVFRPQSRAKDNYWTGASGTTSGRPRTALGIQPVHTGPVPPERVESNGS